MTDAAEGSSPLKPVLAMALPLLSIILVNPACGSATPPLDTAATEAASSPEQECIDAANGVREQHAGEPTRVGLRHILVRHVDSRRADKSITRTRGQACLRALDALQALRAGEDWDSVVAKYSDEKGAATRSGSLGSITRDDVDPAFANAAFDLEVDQLSYVVESPAGFHVILRVE